MGYNNLLVAVILLGWFPVAMMLFMMFPPRRAVMLALFIGWMFLPVAKYELELLPDITKTNVISLAALLGVIFFDMGRLVQFRMRWFDVPAMVLCLTPLGSSMSNELGFYDGVSGVISAALVWGVPYFLGRLYFSDLEDIREFAIVLFLAGIVYMPLCLYEVRMSPQLHNLVYGYHQHDFIQHFRLGGWRPKVFMEHGLMVGMFMTAAALSGYSLWRSRSLTELLGIKIWIFLVPLIVTVFLIKSFNSIFLYAAGMLSLLFIERTKRALPLFVLSVVPVVYVVMRTTFLWPADQIIDAARMIAGPERAQSVAYRVENERMMASHVLERPVFGWGGWDRARLQIKGTRDLTITDSLWVIAWGNTGFLGLAALLVTFLLPGLLLKYRLPPSLWMNPKVAPAVTLALILLLWLNDCLMNAMVGPIYPMMAGSLIGVNKVMTVYPVANVRQPRRAVRNM
jgi:hypothetical protein